MNGRGWTDEHELTAPWVLRFMQDWDRSPAWQRFVLACGLVVLVVTLLLN